MQGIRVVALLAALLVAGPGRASAQLPEPAPSPSEHDISQARDAFVRGMGFANEGRFEAARREFVHSYSLSGSPVALFNLASTLTSLEQHRATVEAYERLLADPSLDPTIRSQAEGLLRQAAALVARIRLHGELGGAILSVDGGPARPLAQSPEVVLLDPGSHRLTARREGSDDWTWAGALSPGEALDLAVELFAPAEPAEVTPEPQEGLDPYLALALAIAAGAVVAALVGGLVADAEAQLSPRTGLVFELP